MLLLYISRHVRDFERKERAWEREKVSQQRDIERLESEIQKPKIMVIYKWNTGAGLN